MSDTNLNTNLKRLSEITDWFDNQESVDVEEGLQKVKEAAQLIKESKLRLKKIENEFEEIKVDISQAIDDTVNETLEDEDTDASDVPF